jgi:hypothetical protein
MQGDGVDPLPLAPEEREREREREHLQRLQTVFPSYLLMLILTIAGQNTTQQESQTLEELR